MAELPPKIKKFIDAVCDAFEIEEPLGDVGYGFRPPENDDDEWIIEVYPIPMEILRGKDDGAEVLPNFTVNVMAIMKLFDKKARGNGWKKTVRFEHHGGKCARVTFDGMVSGKFVMLEVLSSPPEGVKPGFTVDSVTGAFGEKEDPEAHESDKP